VEGGGWSVCLQQQLSVGTEVHNAHKVGVGETEGGGEASEGLSQSP